MNKIARHKAGLMAFNYLNSPLRDESRSFPKAEGFNPQGCSYFLDRHKPCSYGPAWSPLRSCRPSCLPAKGNLYCRTVKSMTINPQDGH